MGIEITAYEISWGAAGLVFALGGAAALSRAVREIGHAPGWALLLMPLAAALLAFVGARAHAMLSSPAGVWQAMTHGGLIELALAARQRIAGGLLLATALLLFAAPRAASRRMSGLQVLDTIVPWSGLSIGVGRVGCFLAGCCFGVPSDRPWAVAYPHGSAAYWNHVAQSHIVEASGMATSLPVHPLSLYLGAAALVSALAASGVRRMSSRAGLPSACFVAFMASLRLFLEPLRETRFLDVVPAQREIDVVLLTAAVAGAGLLLRLPRRPGPWLQPAGARPNGSGPSSPGTPAR